jgi:hypothetical protein
MDDFSIPQLMQNLLEVLRAEQYNSQNVSNVLEQATRFRRQFLQWAQTITSSTFATMSPLQNVQFLFDGQELLPAVQLLATALLSSMVSCSNLDIGAYGNYYGMMILINRLILCLGEHCHLTFSPDFFETDTSTFTYLQSLEKRTSNWLPWPPRQRNSYIRIGH